MQTIYPQKILNEIDLLAPALNVDKLARDPNNVNKPLFIIHTHNISNGQLWGLVLSFIRKFTAIFSLIFWTCNEDRVIETCVTTQARNYPMIQMFNWSTLSDFTT